MDVVRIACGDRRADHHGHPFGGPIVGFLAAGLVALAIVGLAIRMDPETERRASARSRREGAGEGMVPTSRGQGRDWRVAATKRFLGPLVIALVGIVLVVVADRTARIIGWGVLAIAITLAISLVFLEIGYSEDRALSRERRAASRAGRGDRERGRIS